MRPVGEHATGATVAVFTDAAMIRRVLVVTAIVGASRGLFGAVYGAPENLVGALLLVAAAGLLAGVGLAVPGRAVPVLTAVALAAAATVPSFAAARVPLAAGLSVVLGLGLALAAVQAALAATRHRHRGRPGATARRPYPD